MVGRLGAPPADDFGFIARPRQEPPRMAIDRSGIRSLYEWATIRAEAA